MFKRILIAVDESAPAARALESGVSLARELGGELAIAHVVDTASAFHPELGAYDEKLLQELRRAGQLLLKAAVAQVPGEIHAVQMLLEGDPAETIIEAAREWRADAIVLGSDSRGRLAHFLLGSTADTVIRRAPCPVLTVRQQTEVKPRRVAAALQI